jgi:hypothetical protein
MTQTDATNYLIKGIYQVRMAEQEFVEKMTPGAAKQVDKKVEEVLTCLGKTCTTSAGNLEAVKAGLVSYHQAFKEMANRIL